MRQLFLSVMSIATFTLCTYGQGKLDKSSIPEKVKSKFRALYPGTNVEYWTKEDSNYLAEFDHQKKDMIAFISPGGKVIKIETRIHPSGLPKDAQTYISTHYPGKKTTDAVTSTDLKGNRIYEAEVDELDLIFDGQGRFIKSTRERPVE